MRLLQAGGKSGLVINQSHYEELKKFMLDSLSPDTPISLSALLDKGEQRFKHLFKDDTGWFVYNVKLDLEARGLITQVTHHKKGHTAMIKKIERTSASEENFMESQSPGLTKTIREKFLELFGRQPILVHAPGRVNLIGEHTDYNGGFVLPASIDKGVQFAVSRSSSETIIYSARYKQYMSVDLYSVQPVKSPSWNNYLLGVIRKLLDSGYKIKPFYCVFEGDLPSGAGISSSAALACGFGLALSELFNLNLQKAELIHVAQWAEHHFVGVKCGIMDQFACIMGKENHVIKLDCRKLEYEYCPLQLGDYCMLLVDTNVEHSLAISEYNVRRSECEFALDFFRQNGFENITDLRDVSGEMLESIKNILPQVIYNRCLYISTENARVLRAAECLKTGDLTGLGSLLFESHEGLSKLYEVSCPELDFLVTLAAKSEGVIGSRMMGGGFGGCTINLIHSASVGDFVIRAKSEYKTTFNKDLTYQLVKTGPGAHIIDNPRN